jgi:hypothetical protein
MHTTPGHRSRNTVNQRAVVYQVEKRPRLWAGLDEDASEFSRDSSTSGVFQFALRGAVLLHFHRPTH